MPGVAKQSVDGIQGEELMNNLSMAFFHSEVKGWGDQEHFLAKEILGADGRKALALTEEELDFRLTKGVGAKTFKIYFLSCMSTHFHDFFSFISHLS